MDEGHNDGERSDVSDPADDAGVEVYVVGETPPVMAPLRVAVRKTDPDALDPAQRPRDGGKGRQPNRLPSARGMCGRRMGIGCDYFARVHATCRMITQGASGAGGTRDALAIVHAVRVSGCGRAAGARTQAGAAPEGAPETS